MNFIIDIKFDIGEGRVKNLSVCLVFDQPKFKVLYAAAFDYENFDGWSKLMTDIESSVPHHIAWNTLNIYSATATAITHYGYVFPSVFPRTMYDLQPNLKLMNATTDNIKDVLKTYGFDTDPLDDMVEVLGLLSTIKILLQRIPSIDLPVYEYHEHCRQSGIIQIWDNVTGTGEISSENKRYFFNDKNFLNSGQVWLNMNVRFRGVRINMERYATEIDIQN